MKLTTQLDIISQQILV